MPFEIFRRHQRKMLAFLAIFAMVAFTLDFSLLSKIRGGGGANDPVVVTLYGKPVHRSDLALMAQQRSRANRLVGRVLNFPDYPVFGPLNTRALVDAMILEHEANALGMPATMKLAKDWLRLVTRNTINSELFDAIYRNNFAEEATEEGLLIDLANQIRIKQVGELPGMPQTTPLDVYRAFRDQYERISAAVVPFRVADFVDKVADPTDAEVTSFYDKYKTVLPDPKRETPGFMIPRKVRFEYLMVDIGAVTKTIKAKLTEKELREAYDRRKAELPLPPPEFPPNLFADDPKAELTPPHEPFLDVRSYLENLVADEKAREEVDQVLGDLKDRMLSPFSEKYALAVDQNKETKKSVPLPAPGDLLRTAAATIHIEGTKAEYEATRPLDREEADHQPFISQAHVGLTPSSDGRKFADAIFDPRAPLFDPTELTDRIDRRYLGWKVSDEPARVPTVAEIRPEVVHAWKFEKARPLALKEAEALAELARKKGGDVASVAGKRPVITTEPVPRLQASPSFNQFQFNAPRPSEILQIPDAGETLRDALFSLKEKTVAVAPDQPKSTYYVLALNQKTPADFARFVDYNGPYFALKSEVRTEAAARREDSWLAALRAQAGVPPDWKPADESRNEAAQAED